jgi:hypothetical protein
MGMQKGANLPGNQAVGKVLTWKEVGHKVMKVNPPLAEIINELSPDSSYKVIVAKYPFASSIIDNNIYYVPTVDGGLAPLADNKVSKEIQGLLNGYGTFPIGILLQNSVELFVRHGNRIVPFTFYCAGKIFALWGHLDADISYQKLQMWNMTAGARSIMMAPKIADNVSHRKLQQALNLTSPPPKDMHDHWALFSEIYRNDSNKEPWHTEALFFSKKWLDAIKNDKAWARLYVFLLKEAWHSSSFWRCQIQFNLIFNKFINWLTERNIKINSGRLDTIKHLIIISLGALPGFAPAINEIAAPIKLLQSAYLNYYNLKEYVPTVMAPQYFLYGQDVAPAYYSLQRQTLLESIQSPKTPVNLITELEEIQATMSHFLLFMQSGVVDLECTPLAILKNIQYDYYHNNKSHTKKIVSSRQMAEDDPRLRQMFGGQDKRVFCSAAQFVRGCVKISSK